MEEAKLPLAAASYLLAWSWSEIQGDKRYINVSLWNRLQEIFSVLLFWFGFWFLVFSLVFFFFLPVFVCLFPEAYLCQMEKKSQSQQEADFFNFCFCWFSVIRMSLAFRLKSIVFNSKQRFVGKNSRIHNFNCLSTCH